MRTDVDHEAPCACSLLEWRAPVVGARLPRLAHLPIIVRSTQGLCRRKPVRASGAPRRGDARLAHVFRRRADVFSGDAREPGASRRASTVEEDAVIVLTRLNGAAFALNADLIERAEATPDTVVTLVDGKKYVVAEDVHEIVQRVRDFRARVIAGAHALEDAGGDGNDCATDPPTSPAPARRTARIVPLPLRED
jgi:flagellar protein FlbD